MAPGTRRGARRRGLVALVATAGEPASAAWTPAEVRSRSSRWTALPTEAVLPARPQAAASTWRRPTASRTATSAGGNLCVRVSHNAAAAGSVLEADGFVLTAVGP